MKIRILTASQVRAALPMPAAIDAMRSAFSQLSAGEAEVPLRGRVGTGKGVSLLMPAYMKKSGELGQLLQLAIAVEQNDIPTINSIIGQLYISQNELNECVLLSYRQGSTAEV